MKEKAVSNNSTAKHNMCVIGFGFLGSSIVHVFNLHADIKIYDKYKESDTIEDAVSDSEFVWMCLPTPMKKSDGSCDLSIVEENVSAVNDLSDPKSGRIVIIKSTVTPGTCRQLQKKYKNISIVSCPEFLTARAHLINSLSPNRIIIGTENKDVGDRTEDMFRHRFGNAINIFRTSWEKAEMCKLGANIFFATKVMYFNFIYEMCKNIGIEYDDVRDLILSDGRIAVSHADIPGHDGSVGFGGMCFSKDICSLIFEANNRGVDAKFLEEIWERNLRIRKDRDWEQMSSAFVDDVEK